MPILAKACAFFDLSVSHVRALAARVVCQVLAGRSLSEVLPAALVGVPKAQHSFFKALCYGTLRWYPRLEFILGQLLRRPIKEADVHALALIGLHQLGHMAVKPHAAIAETVSAAKPWAKSLVNGILRNYQRRREELEALADADYEAEFGHPCWLRRKIEQAWPKQAAAILTANNQQAPLVVRVNLKRISRQAYSDRLAKQGLSARPVAGVDTALVIEPPVPVENLPGFAQGLVSVQDAAAQLAAPLLVAQPGQRVLDVCAAPGGKTLHILESCPEIAELVAVDIAPKRLEKIQENLIRARLSKVSLRCGDARRPQDWWDGELFARILVDAPCTATGVIRRHPDIKLLRRESDLATLVRLQRDILEAVWPLLSVGGVLLYATCSLLPEENEAQIQAFLSAHPDARCVPIEAEWGAVTGCGRQIWPGGDWDGFFYARLEKCVCG